MNKLSLLFATATLAFSSCGNPSTNFRGEVTGVSSDTLLIYSSSLSGGRWFNVDTVALHDGKFEVNVADTIPLEISIAAKSPYGSRLPQILGDAFYLLPGEKITVKGDVPGGLVASGTALYDGLAKQGKLSEINAALLKLERLQDGLDEEKDAAQIDSIWAECDELEKQRNEISMDIIRKNPSDVVSAYLCLDLFPAQGVEAIGMLTEELRHGVFAQLLAEKLEECERELEIERVGESIQPGKTAPMFTLKGLDGNPVTLEQFRGKHVVLDFWGTWCGWCLAGIPKMKEYYAKYQDKVEFVGICCFDRPDKWKKCVHDQQMNWTQVIDDKETDISMTYAVSGYPTKILVDPQGKIVEVFDGESAEFYDCLDRLFRK